MKPLRLIPALALLFAGIPAIAQTSTSHRLEFDHAQSEYEMAVKQALAPIDKRYVETLQQLLKRATTGGDLETANKIQEALAQKGAISIYTRLVGTKWTFPVKNTPREQQWIEFQADGILRTGWGPSPKSWKQLEGDKVQVQPYGQEKYKFILDMDGGLRRATIIEGESKGQKIERLN